MLFLYDSNENLIHELPSKKLSSIHQIEELNKLMILEFGVQLDAIDWMEGIEYVAHRDFENPERMQMYRILTSEPDSNSMNYQAIHILFDELKSYGYIRDKRPTRAKASAVLSEVLSGTRWKVGRVDDSDLLSTNFYDCTRLEALSKILNIWQMDLEFYLTFKGSRITGRYINLYKQRGEDTGERFVYGSNALEVVKELDKSEVYTRIIPRGKGEEKFDENGKPTDGHGRRIKIDDVVWSKDKGDPIDKPKGQEYVESIEMTKKFGFSDGEPRTKVQIFEDIEKSEDLIKAGYDFLIKASRPLVQFKTKVYKKSRTNVGDIVRVIRKDLDIYYRTRIYKANRNLLTGNVEVEFGDKLITSQAERDKKLINSLGALQDRIIETETEIRGSFVDKVTDELTNAMFNRDGYNYELKAGNKYNLPAGYYSFDREIDDNPQRVIYVGAGTLAIADSKKSNGDWDFRTFGTGQGFTADLLVAGTILGGKVRWNLEDGTFLIGDTPSDFSMYWDGSTLHLRNVDIDLENSSKFKQLEEDNQRTKEEIEQRKAEISGALDRIAETRRKMDEQNRSLQEDIYKVDSDVKRQLGTVKYDMTNLDKAVKTNKDDFITYKKEREIKDVTLERELLEMKSKVDITNENISTSVSSLTRSVEAQLTETKTYAKNLLGESKTYTDRELSDYKTYVSNNYASLYQTDKMINATVGEIKTDVSNANSKVNNLSSQLYMTKSEIRQKVSRNEIISEINQSPEQVKIKAEKIDLEGNMTLKGKFETLNNEDNIGISINYNKMQFADQRGYNKKYGEIRVSKDINEDWYSLTMGHFNTGALSISYLNDKTNLWNSYIAFDKYNNYTHKYNEPPIRVYEDIGFYKNAEFGNAEIFGEIRIKGFKLKKLLTGIALVDDRDNGFVVGNDAKCYVRYNGVLREVLTR